MKKFIIVLIVPIFFGFKTGTDIDEKRMNRDLEISKNILVTLIKSGSDSFFGGESIDASYIKDYGVVFTIPEHLVYFHAGGNLMVIPEMPEIPDLDVIVDFNYDFNVDVDNDSDSEEDREHKEQDKARMKADLRRAERETQRAMKDMEKVHEDMEEAHREAVMAQAEVQELQEFYVNKGQTSDIDWEEIMITFMTDYADLISQLQPTEKIVINQKSPQDEMVFIWAQDGSSEKIENDNSSISAEVLRKDVTAFKSGKIKQEEYVKRIVIKKKEPQKKIADLEMFANIFDRFYSADLTETYYSQGKPRYEVLDGFGVVFHIKASSGRSSYRRVEYYSSGNSWTVKPDGKDTNDEGLYPKFKEDLKSFMLDYGRTIRSLKDDDMVLLEIEINSCRGCEIPKSLEVSTNMSLLKQYDQQKISREKARGQIEIKETL